MIEPVIPAHAVARASSSSGVAEAGGRGGSDRRYRATRRRAWDVAGPIRRCRRRSTVRRRGWVEPAHAVKQRRVLEPLESLHAGSG